MANKVDHNAVVAKNNNLVGELAKFELSELRLIAFCLAHLDSRQPENPEITANPINNSSIAFRLWDATKSVLFTGDLGPEGGEKLLNSDQARHLPADYVQMAHHGQKGVSEAFYAAVNPSFCLWPTPKWLWDNDNGGGPGSGPWKTLEVRAWMDKLAIKRHYCMHEGLHEIR